MKFTDFLEITSNEHQYNCKHGGFFMPNLRKIIITSVQKPTEIYKNVQENRQQIYRRITKIIEHYKDSKGYQMREITNNDDTHNHEQIHDVPCDVSISEIDWNKIEWV